MDIQMVLVLLLFAGALFYLGRMLYRNLHSKKACASGCGKCAVEKIPVEKK